MIYITGDFNKDRMLTPYVKQLQAIKQQCGHIDSDRYIELIDSWLDAVLKAIEVYDKLRCSG